MITFNKIIIPTKIQTDTLVSIFLLKKFGGKRFIGIENAEIQMCSIIENPTEEGVVFVDIGGGEFDHHLKKDQTTATKLVIQGLDLDEDASLKKMQYLAERCDFFGKGIISKDQIDRTFGLPGLLVSVNKLYENDPQKVFEVFAPILEAHLIEERIVERIVEVPVIVEKIKIV